MDQFHMINRNKKRKKVEREVLKHVSNCIGITHVISYQITGTTFAAEVNVYKV